MAIAGVVVAVLMLVFVVWTTIVMQRFWHRKYHAFGYKWYQRVPWSVRFSPEWKSWRYRDGDEPVHIADSKQSNGA